MAHKSAKFVIALALLWVVRGVAVVVFVAAAVVVAVGVVVAVVVARPWQQFEFVAVAGYRRHNYSYHMLHQGSSSRRVTLKRAACSPPSSLPLSACSPPLHLLSYLSQSALCLAICHIFLALHKHIRFAQ